MLGRDGTRGAQDYCAVPQIRETSAGDCFQDGNKESVT